MSGTNNDNLSDTQKRLLVAMRSEMIEVSASIMAEIDRLRQENERLHQERVQREDQLFARFRSDIKRHALGLLGLAQMSDEEIDDWLRKKGK
jgi:hypothetical protein